MDATQNHLLAWIQMSGQNSPRFEDGLTLEACGRIDISELLGPIHPAQVVDGSTRLQFGQRGFLETDLDPGS